MKIVGLITEYNPFHNGHLYHIHESLRITGADAALVVMSGDYVQRGTPAIMPKRLRTEMALYCGAGANHFLQHDRRQSFSAPAILDVPTF